MCYAALCFDFWAGQSVCTAQRGLPFVFAAHAAPSGVCLCEGGSVAAVCRPLES